MKLTRMIGHTKLLQANRSLVEVTYLEALEKGEREPAILLLDPQDATGRWFAEGFGLGDQADAMISEARRLSRPLSLVGGLPRAQAVAILADTFSEVADTVAEPNEDGWYWVVVIAAGSASAVLMSPVAVARS